MRTVRTVRTVVYADLGLSRSKPVGAGGAIDTNTVTRPIIAFVVDPQGLMYNLSLEGSKMAKRRRPPRF